MSQEGNARATQTYDVALWRWWPSLFPEYVGHIEATGSFAALVYFMEELRIEKAAYAAVRQVGHAHIDRRSKVYLPLEANMRVRG